MGEKYMKKILTLIIVFTFSFALTSCAQVEENDVYVTVYPMKYIVEEIFQNTTYTVGIVPGVTSHGDAVDWSFKEISAMTEATYLFYVGANYDQYIDIQIEAIFTDRDVKLVKIEEESDYIEFITGVAHSHDHDSEDDHSDEEETIGLDPHFWISPNKVLEVTELIYDKLILEFNDPYGIMEDNYENLISNLQALSDDYNEVISNTNNQNDIIMTSTNIYGYLENDYGLEYISISPGYHEETEQHIDEEDLLSEALFHDIRYLIYEKYTTSPSTDFIFDKLIEEEKDPIKVEFDILQSLSDDRVEQGENYISVMYENLELLKLALGYQSE